ncbi:hypothetical protein CYMTET_15805 [Cymbomonas tetramitiformis]|uniref:Uncharacterized protein n=1 Tax=Cymbomonas tetramitiformis TaxID=36881 RepID=A0AAE0GDC8_9CHLO|nr:hypothetical protein CYMTET_15805 [Cymbomonas tetramitiformis]
MVVVGLEVEMVVEAMVMVVGATVMVAGATVPVLGATVTVVVGATVTAVGATAMTVGAMVMVGEEGMEAVVGVWEEVTWVRFTEAGSNTLRSIS